MAYVESGGAAQAPSAAPATPTMATPPQAPAAPAAARPVVDLSGDDVTQPITGMQKAMVKSMTAATAIPHLTYCEEFDLGKLVELRGVVNEMRAASGESKLSFMPFFIKACSMALAQYPVLNAKVNGDCTELTYKAAHNIGLAVDSPNGLVVPNIKNVQTLTIAEIGAEVQRLVALAAAGKLGQSDLTGGTFTISNIGTVGGTYATPILVPGEVAIVALGRMQKLPRFDAQGNVYAASVMNASFSADHRIVDGASVAKMCRAWQTYLENPAAMMTELR